MTTRVVITGANSAVGQVVVERALARTGVEIVAAVRSERAAGEVPAIPGGRGRVVQMDYGSPESMSAAFEGASALVHLPGLLIETPNSTYEMANVETTRAAVHAAQGAGLHKLVLVSAVGADATSTNRYFQSKGVAEDLVCQSGIPFTVLRCPMVLACRSHGVRALVRETGQSLLPLIGGGRNLDQPIDARDLAEGALNAAAEPDRARNAVLDFVGPERLPMRGLIARGAALRGVSQRVLTIPRGAVKGLLGLKQRFSKGGMTPEVIDVLQLDVDVDPKIAAQALGVELRPLDDTLRDSFALWEDA